MYLPYFRGKQFELLALKEYAAELGASTVGPLIEPVKDPRKSGGLTRCLDALTRNGVRPGVVVNPIVGDMVGESANVLANYLDQIDPSGDKVDAIILVHQDSTAAEVAQSMGELPSHRSVVTCHVAKNPFLNDMAPTLQRSVTHVIPADSRQRVYRTAFPEAKFAILSDPFDAKARNADYLPVAAAEFSDDFLYYVEEGYVGFGDYLTIGNGWAEGGFTPRAVAIHWTYQDAEGGPIMIRHFVSKSNDDISNVGRKYLEAVEKLVDFLPSALFVTRAGDVFRESLESASFPGLGIVKKLSMQNHLEVVMRAIAE